MKKRKPGNRLEVSATGLGCMGMSFGCAPFREKKDSIKLIHQGHGRHGERFDCRRQSEIFRPLGSGRPNHPPGAGPAAGGGPANCCLSSFNS